MKEEILRAFENLLTNSGGWKPDSYNLSFERIDQEEARELEKPFTKMKFLWLWLILKGTKCLVQIAFLLVFGIFPRTLLKRMC